MIRGMAQWKSMWRLDQPLGHRTMGSLWSGAWQVPTLLGVNSGDNAFVENVKFFGWPLLQKGFFSLRPPPFELFFFQNCFIFMSSSTARALGSYSHSKGFGAELLSDSLVMVLWGGLGAPEGSVEGSTMTSLNLSPKLCLAFFPNSVSFGVFSHSKGLRAKWHVCLLGFFAANGFRLPKRFFGVFPKRAFFGQMAVASEKVLWKVPPTMLFYLPVSLWGQSCVNCWHVSPSLQTTTSSCRCCWSILWVYIERNPPNWPIQNSRFKIGEVGWAAFWIPQFFFWNPRCNNGREDGRGLKRWEFPEKKPVVWSWGMWFFRLVRFGRRNTPVPKSYTCWKWVPSWFCYSEWNR